MTPIYLLVLILVLSCFNAATTLGAAGLPHLSKPSTAASMIVTLRPDANAEAVVREHSLKPSHSYRHALTGFAAQIDGAKIEQLRHDPRVRAVEPDGPVQLCGQTLPYGVLGMGLTNFPPAHMNGGDHRIAVDVAVLDGGIQTNHPDLNVVQWVDLTGAGYGGGHFHGTAVAGVIGALDNDFGVVGVAPGARLWSVQVFPPGSGVTSDSLILAGMDYIATNADKITVVNASFAGSGGAITAKHEAVLSLVNRGIVFVAAAEMTTRTSRAQTWYSAQPMTCFRLPLQR